MGFVRKRTSQLTPGEWKAFIEAVDAMHGAGASSPAYREFVQLHVDAFGHGGMSWGVHTMPEMGMDGFNFLSWHRRFLHSFEKQLGVALPYWDWTRDRVLPPEISTPALLRRWSVRRQWNASELPTSADVSAVMARTTFESFQGALESGPHNAGHRAVGGTMASASSPADPIFWMHHSNIDRLWNVWQSQPGRPIPSNANKKLLPTGGKIIKGTVNDTLDLSSSGLDYTYS